MFPVRPGDANEELRYSLRSICANLPHRRVWLAGHRPPWVADSVGWIPTRQVPGAKWANARKNRLAACRHPEVAERFVLFNDDMFVIAALPDGVPVLHRGRVADVAADYRRRGIRVGSSGLGDYLRGLLDTAAWLQTRGVADPVSYELHLPMPMPKTGLADAIQGARATGLVIPHIRTIVGNLQGLGGERARDVKITDLQSVPAVGASFVSTTDGSFANGAVGAWLRERFPDPCRYER